MFFSWLRSSIALSLPGLVFALIFTVPNYFQLRTITNTKTTPIVNRTHFDQVSITYKKVFPY